MSRRLSDKEKQNIINAGLHFKDAGMFRSTCKVLHLTLKAEAYNVMVTGEKKQEYRTPSKWIEARLNKEYDYIKFVNGYGKNRPYFVAEYKGYTQNNLDNIKQKYSNNFEVNVNKGDYIIFLGEIVEKFYFE